MGTTGGAVIQPSAAVMLFAAWLLAYTPAASGLWLALPPSGTKCVSEEIHVGVVALADYSVGHEDDGHITPTISAKVTSPNGNILHENKNATDGQFGFTTSEPGSFLACFWLDDENKTTGASVSINWKMGFAAQDWASVAKKEKIEGVELVLRKLESSVDVIHENLLYLRSREANMRDVSERTNSRVAMFSMMSIGVCILASALQLWHLKGYFEKKKLI